jgi:hypothetical protein
MTIICKKVPRKRFYGHDDKGLSLDQQRCMFVCDIAEKRRIRVRVNMLGLGFKLRLGLSFVLPI